MRLHVVGLVGLMLLFAGPSRAADPVLPLLLEEDFEKGAERWEPTDPKVWKIAEVDGKKIFSQFEKGKYEPPYRSPFHIALLKDVIVSDFVLTAKLRSTVKDYNHRDMVLVFGHQDPAHFYYVHLGKKADDHANQIFIVNSAPRIKISTTSTPGTDWDDAWHNVKVARTVADGKIEIYFDDMQKPIMTATDKNFLYGRIGIGSFDDTGDWDEVKLWGVKAAKK